MRDDDEDERLFQQFEKSTSAAGARASKAAAHKDSVLAARQPFVKVPLWWITEATKATKTPAALVCVQLLHTAWKTKNMTFAMSNERLAKNGVSREVKRRVLRDLEAAGLITVERRNGRSPRVTLVLV